MITIYGKDNCTFCEQAKALCKQKGVEFEYKLLGKDFQREVFIAMMQEDFAVTPRSMPQIVSGGTYIGGFAELKQHLC